VQLTLLFGLKQKTISECTFRLLSRFSTKSFIARYAAARTCILDTICVGNQTDLQVICHVMCVRKLTTLASIRAYSKSEQLLLKERSVLDGFVERNMNGAVDRQMLEMD